jgi:hypothetical protein
MTDIREQAAKAAREWRAQQLDPRDQFHDIGEAAVAIGYELGHAAGVEDGARGFAEWCFQRTVQWVVKSDLDVEIARYLWWRWKGQDGAHRICELTEHYGELYWSHQGFLTSIQLRAAEDGPPIPREWWPVRIEEPPKGRG